MGFVVSHHFPSARKDRAHRVFGYFKQTRFVINRLFPNTRLGAEIMTILSGFNFPVLDAVIHNRTEYAKSARNGLTALETDPTGLACREVRALADEVSIILTKNKGAIRAAV